MTNFDFRNPVLCIFGFQRESHHSGSFQQAGERETGILGRKLRRGKEAVASAV